jgi:hypothetical protein
VDLLTTSLHVSFLIAAEVRRTEEQTASLQTALLRKDCLARATREAARESPI